MGKIFKKSIMVLIISALLTGCATPKWNLSSENSNESESVNSADDLEMELASNQNSSEEVLGKFEHGIMDDNADKVIEYTGDDILITYGTYMTGQIENAGFLVFLDGIPQQYKTDFDKEYKYMHILSKNNEEDQLFNIIFSPTVGNAGDTLELVIVGLTNPEYCPDMVNTTAYGINGKSSAEYASVVFNANADVTMTSNESEQEWITSVEYNKTPLTEENKKEILGGWISDDSDFEKKSYSKFYINGENGGMMSSMDISSIESCTIQYDLSGQPGVQYGIVLFYDNRPIAYEGSIRQVLEIEKGYISSLVYQLDLSRITEGHSFYILQIPMNLRDYPSTVITQKKTNSIYFYTQDMIKQIESEITKDIESSNLSLTYQIKDLEKVQINTIDEISMVQSVGDGKLLISAGNLYLYDCTKKQIEQQIACSGDLNGGFKIYNLEQGYALIGAVGEEYEQKVYNLSTKEYEILKGNYVGCILYDQDWNIVEEIDFSKVISQEIDINKVTVSTDGNQFAFISDEGILLYNNNTRELKKILSLEEADNQYAIFEFSALEFTKDDQTLNIIGYLLDHNSNSSSTFWGILSIDGTIKKVKAAKDIGKMIISQGVTLFTQADVYGNPSGEVLSLNQQKKTITELSLTKRSESEHVWGSVNKEHYMTSEQLSDQSWKIRIYKISGELETEFVYSALSAKEYQAPSIYLDEEKNQIMLFFQKANEENQNKLVIGTYKSMKIDN